MTEAAGLLSLEHIVLLDRGHGQHPVGGPEGGGAERGHIGPTPRARQLMQGCPGVAGLLKVCRVVHCRLLCQGQGVGLQPGWGRAPLGQANGGVGCMLPALRAAVGEVKDACSVETGTLQVRGQSVVDQNCSAAVLRHGAPAWDTSSPFLRGGECSQHSSMPVGGSTFSSPDRRQLRYKDTLHLCGLLALARATHEHLPRRQILSTWADRDLALLCCACGPLELSMGCAACRSPCRVQARACGLRSCRVIVNPRSSASG